MSDPACDVAIAWTFFSAASREEFRRCLADEGTWARPRGWALWKALITMADPDTDAPKRTEAWHVLDEVMNEFKHR